MTISHQQSHVVSLCSLRFSRLKQLQQLLSLAFYLRRQQAIPIMLKQVTQLRVVSDTKINSREDYL